MSHRNGPMSSYTGVFSWLLIFCLVSTFLARTAAGSCLQYGHSCWGAHGKRSEIAPSAPLADLNDVTGQDESWEESAEEEPAWQKLRRVVTHRTHHALPPSPPIRQHNVMSEDQDDEQPPPRWLYQLMRQAAATKMD